VHKHACSRRTLFGRSGRRAAVSACVWPHADCLVWAQQWGPRYRQAATLAAIFARAVTVERLRSATTLGTVTWAPCPDLGPAPRGRQVWPLPTRIALSYLTDLAHRRGPSAARPGHDPSQARSATASAGRCRRARPKPAVVTYAKVRCAVPGALAWCWMRAGGRDHQPCPLPAAG
jgi:hypothetical protein